MAFRITINSSSGVPFYKQIINQIMFAVVNRMLAPGEQLPTVRQLAVDLQINLNTVVKAYKELEIRGIVTTQQGTGTFISDHLAQPDKAVTTRHLDRLCEQFLAEITAQGITIDEALRALQAMASKRNSMHKGALNEKGT